MAKRVSKNIPREMAKQQKELRALKGDMEQTISPNAYLARVHLLLSGSSLEGLRNLLKQAKRTRMVRLPGYPGRSRSD